LAQRRRRPAARPAERAPAAPRTAPAPWGPRLRAVLAQALDLPPELVLDLPRLTLLGPLHLAVENHRGLLGFDSGRVAIAIAAGRLVVEGSDLRLGVVREGEITIAGLVAAVRFEPLPPAAGR
jgi:sporulation protein YqfC